MHATAKGARILLRKESLAACAGLAGFAWLPRVATCDVQQAGAWSFPRPAAAAPAESKRLARVHEAETRLLDLMLPGTPYAARDVAVRLDVRRRCRLMSAPQTEYAVRTVTVGAEHSDKPPIVLVHGFMMGSAAFFKWLPYLARERTVHAVDVMGMGGSGRPPFDAGRITAEEAEQLLVEPLQQWADSMGLREFDLLGHSFGGFICAAWATRNDGRIRRLGLLSPLLGFSDERIASMRPKADAPWQTRALLCILETAWARGITPHTLVRWVPGAKGWMEKASTRRFQSMATGVTETEGRLLSEYVIATMDTPASTEGAATVCFEPFLRPVEVEGGTIKKRLSGLEAPLFAVYGDRDWMDKPRPGEVPNCELFVLDRSGHHLYLDNPEALAALVMRQLAVGARA